MRVGVAVVAALWLGTACMARSPGSAAVASPDGGSTPAPLPDAGGGSSPAQDGGAAMDAGLPPGTDAGSGSDAGTPPGGGGEGTPDGGTASGGQDGGTTLSSDCTFAAAPGIDPAFRTDLGTATAPHPVCSFARPDDLEGTIPLLKAVPNPNGTATWLTTVLFIDSSTGRGHGEFSTTRLGGVLTQPQGFAIVEIDFPPQPAVSLRNFNHRGEMQGTTPVGARASVVEDPSGGLVSVETIVQQDQSLSFTWRRFDRHGAPEAGPVSLPASGATVGGGFTLAVAGVTLGGHTLVFYGSLDGCSGIWLDHEGRFLTAPFTPRDCRATVGFLWLLDGSLVQRRASDEGDSFFLAGRWADTATEPSALPEFLRQHPAVQEFFLLPNGHGYALRDPGPGDAAHFHLYAPAGNFCSTYTPRGGLGPFTIGRDGTLVTLDLTGAGCKFSWYPQLFE